MKYVTSQRAFDKNLIEYISKKYDLHRAVAAILISRGFGDDLDDFFFNEEIHDPYLLNDMERASKCINEHIDAGDKITIYGDYDVDGVCASAILYLYFKAIGANVSTYLPDRHNDGYGLNNDSIDKIADDGTKLIITVDCGISNFKEVEHAKLKGLDVIVTDHHQCPEVLPECEGVINPLLGDYPYRLLCGSAVALKLIHAIGGKECFDRYCDLAALATVADLVPLTGENRSIVKRGLNVINSDSCRPGIRAILTKAGINGEVTAGHIGFGIAPRINAAGRIALAKEAFDVLVCDDYNCATEMSHGLNEHNDERKREELDILKQAKAKIDSDESSNLKRIITVCGQGWNKGVIGIVASRLVEIYKRPVIVFSCENNVCVGSGRSILGVHLFNLLNQFNDLFVKYGGHEMAAGMTIEADKLCELSFKLNEYAVKHFSDEIFIPKMEYDLEINLEDINNKLVNDISRLSPMGMGNKTPVFCIRGVEIRCPRIIGAEQNHIKMSISNGGISLDAVAFSMSDRFNDIEIGYKYDIIAAFEINSWNNRDYIQLQIKEFKPSARKAGDRFISINGNRYFESLMLAADLPIIPIDHTRIRQMWNWDIYLGRRLKKDVLNTVIYSAVPTCSYELINFLIKEKLDENVDYCFGVPKQNSCVVFAPDWSVDKLNYSRLVIFDYAPTDFIERVIKNNPNIQIVICNNDFTENCLSRFVMGIDFDREKARVYYSIINKLCKDALSIEMVVNGFCKLGNETAFNAYFALKVFSELELITFDDNMISLKNIDNKKDLFKSGTVKKLLSLKERIGQEVELIKPPRNNKGKNNE